MKSFFVAISLLLSVQAGASTLAFTESENRALRAILSSIAPVETADAIYCSISEAPMPHKNPVVFCGVDYTDSRRWLAKFRTKWISSRYASLLVTRGQCEYVDGWTKPQVKPYRCQLKNVSCAPNGCSAN